MCGILAVIGKADKEEVIIRSARMSHRGPDERDVQVTSLGILSHERLAIVDLNTGKQPLMLREKSAKKILKECNSFLISDYLILIIQ